jgi:protein tyrosine phosphatase (PTP) superfamily phosphohydrolase (DUF442 family)
MPTMNSPEPMNDICNYLQLGEQLHTSGQPSATQLESLGRYGIRTVINLAMPTSDNAVESEGVILAGQSIRYLQIPVNWENPETVDFQIFTNVFPLVDNAPVLIHCAKNMRVSAFMYLYRRVELGFDHHLALKDLQKIWTPTDQWYHFMNTILQKAGLCVEDFT